MAVTVGRDFQLFGPALIEVKGNGNLGSGNIATLWQLGLSEDPIHVRPIFRHSPVNTSDFDQLPVDMQWMLDEVRIRTHLIHYDPVVLAWVLAESRGGIWTNHTQFLNNPIGVNLNNTGEGAYVGAGCLLGNGLPLLASGNHFVGLQIAPAIPNLVTYRFFSTFVPSQPLEYPIGTQKTSVDIEWRAIPYAPMYQSGGSMTSGGVSLNVNGVVGIYTPVKEAQSSGTVLWDRGMWRT